MILFLEWTIVQITQKFSLKDALNIKPNTRIATALHISVFSCGKNQTKPFCVTVKEAKDKTGCTLEVGREMDSIISDNLKFMRTGIPGAKKKNLAVIQSYLYNRHCINHRLKDLVKIIQDNWLREWKCLLFGKLIDKKKEESLRDAVNALLKRYKM